MSESISSLLNKQKGNNQNTLYNVVRKYQLIAALNNTLKETLSTSFVQFCAVINVNQSSVILQCSNPAATNKLRYQTTELTDSFRKNGFPWVSNVQIKTLPHTDPSFDKDSSRNAQAKTLPPLSDTAISQLEQLENNSSAEMKDALRHFINRQRERNTP